MDLAVDFNNIGVDLHRLQRYEEAEEMFRGAVQLLLRSKGSCMLTNPTSLMNHHESKRPELFDALVQDDQIRSAASKIQDKAVNVGVLSSGVHDVDRIDDQVMMTTESTPYDMAVPETVDSPASTSIFASSSQGHHHDHQDFPTTQNIPQGIPAQVDDIVHRQGLSSGDPSTSPISSVEGSSMMTLMDPQSRRPRDEFSVYMCLDAIRLDAASSTEAFHNASLTNTLAAFVDTTSSSLRPNHQEVPHYMDDANTANTATSQNDNAIGRYDFETIVVLYNMALTLHCLNQLTLSCYIYDLADRVLRGQSMDKVRNDKVASQLVMAISNNLGQILLKLGYSNVARTYVDRLASFLLYVDPPATAEQAKERLEFILNIYWFDHPPSAPAA
jgi:hypothetical protein